jgi:hypothetical protein
MERRRIYFILFFEISIGPNISCLLSCLLSCLPLHCSVITEEDADRVWSCVENAIQMMMADEEAAEEE